MVPCTSSGLLSSSAVVYVGPCVIHAIILVDAAAAATAIVYDNATTNSGNVVGQVNATVNASSASLVLNHPVVCLAGAYVALTGTSAGVIVHYSPR